MFELDFNLTTTLTTTSQALAVMATLIAAVTDTRTGHIPNWLTLPAIGIGLAINFWLGGPMGLLGSALSMVLCGLPPYMIFTMGAMGGGDVKLFAALGALVGMQLGLEAQVYAVIAALCWAMYRAVREQRWKQALSTTLAMAINPLLPKARRRQVDADSLTAIRLGAAIFAGTVIAVLMQHRESWF